MFTVIPKNLLVAPGIKEFIAPLTKSAWCFIILSVLCIFVLVSRVAIKIRYSTVIFAIFGHLTDHWILLFKPKLQCIFLLWGILCYSLTVLYGGELASSLAVLKAPIIPTCLEELLDLGTNIISLGTIETESGSQSKLVDSLQSQNFKWSNSSEQLGRQARAIHEANFGYCDQEMRVFNRRNAESPFLCKDKPYFTNPKKPITFVDNKTRFILERYVFQDSSKYWVSSMSQIPKLQDQFPLVLSRNYFAKLVLPFASFWAASGLENVWEEV